MESCAECLELRRVLEELFYLHELFDSFIDPRDVVEGDLGHIFGYLASPALAERHHPVSPALHLLHEEQDETDHEQERQDLYDYRQDARAGLRVDLDGLYLTVYRLGDIVVRWESRLELLFIVERDVERLVAVVYLYGIDAIAVYLV